MRALPIAAAAFLLVPAAASTQTCNEDPKWLLVSVASSSISFTESGESIDTGGGFKRLLSACDVGELSQHDGLGARSTEAFTAQEESTVGWSYASFDQTLEQICGVLPNCVDMTDPAMAELARRAAQQNRSP